eukprot:6205255-Pleurochrysis_carterae.AAC.2
MNEVARGKDQQRLVWNFTTRRSCTVTPMCSLQSQLTGSSLLAAQKSCAQSTANSVGQPFDTCHQALRQHDPVSHAQRSGCKHCSQKHAHGQPAAAPARVVVSVRRLEAGRQHEAEKRARGEAADVAEVVDARARRQAKDQVEQQNRPDILHQSVGATTERRTIAQCIRAGGAQNAKHRSGSPDGNGPRATFPETQKVATDPRQNVDQSETVTSKGTLGKRSDTPQGVAV